MASTDDLVFLPVSSRAMTTPEIIDEILPYLAMADLFRALRISHTWKKAIESHTELRNKLIFKETTVTTAHILEDVEPNPLFPAEELAGHILGCGRRFISMLGPFDFPFTLPLVEYSIQEGHTLTCVLDINSNDRSDVLALGRCVPESAKKMYLTMPALETRVGVFFPVTGKKHGEARIVYGGLDVSRCTLGEMLEAAEWLIQCGPPDNDASLEGLRAADARIYAKMPGWEKSNEVGVIYRFASRGPRRVHDMARTPRGLRNGIKGMRDRVRNVKCPTR